jgi:hypothetical protein
MTTATDIVNWALQTPGTRTTVTDAELAANSTNEAIQANLKLDNVRRRLLRMAPWNCALKTANLVYITSTPGTPENTSPQTLLWQPGQPSPPWNYEYQYPVDCLRPCWIIPASQTGFAGGIPITTAVTGGASSFWQGPPVKFKVQNDTFVPVVSASVVSGGTGYAVGDLLQGPGALINGVNPTLGQPPVGGPVLLQVATLAGSAVATVNVLPQVNNLNTSPAFAGVAQGPLIGGSYFAKLPNPVATSALTGSGSGATFNLLYGNPASQRVILCNQEFATCSYIQDITDPDLMDDQFRDAWAKALGAELTIPLTGDKKLANMVIGEVNQAIQWARTGDGNEGFTVNDVTPDWIRIRGIDFASPYSGPFTGYDWGGMYPIFG